ncbi:MAG: gamma-glutamyl-gamma-aminobutyrate hydrolase family protein [bacterium]|nr:gamma-glutamyl-gamma-aminobutyrate hydrolase family protein [candidate division KSB1 bacterium]MDH7561513.1 gamma-glutamyl-gamma-aminobutyrate hydrolase family protein [bacterium]
MAHSKKSSTRTPKAMCLAATFFACAWLGATPVYAQLSERYFAEQQNPPMQVCVAVFYPTTGTLEELIALRREGLMPATDLLVVGVYHEKEIGDYQAARRYVEERQLDWVQFHRISGDLSPANIYQDNSCRNDFAQIVRLSDGAILFGGPDIPPQCYGHKTHLATAIKDVYRHYLDLTFVFYLLGGSQNNAHRPLLAEAPDYPLLGICLGAQTINVATGGTLVQDIWQVTYGKQTYEDVLRLGPERWHTNPYRGLYPDARLLGYHLHHIRLKQEGFFCQSLGFSPSDAPLVVSSHHQAVDKPGRGIVVAATSMDGRVVEAITHRTFKNVLGVQFHPDFPILWDAELRFRFTPEGEETSIRALLEADAPGLAFNRAVWIWFFGKAAERHRSRS